MADGKQRSHALKVLRLSVRSYTPSCRLIQVASLVLLPLLSANQTETSSRLFLPGRETDAACVFARGGVNTCVWAKHT